MAGSFLTSDLVSLFAASEFGAAEGSITHRGSPIPMGIFEEDDVEIVSGEGFPMMVRAPMFTGRASDFPAIADGDAFVVSGEAFVVKHWEFESGVITIMLERV